MNSLVLILPRYHSNLEDTVRFATRLKVRIQIYQQYSSNYQPSNNVLVKKLPVLFSKKYKTDQERSLEEVSVPNIIPIIQQILKSKNNPVIYRGLSLNNIFWYFVLSLILSLLCYILGVQYIRYEQIIIRKSGRRSLNELAKLLSVKIDLILGHKLISPVGIISNRPESVLKFSAIRLFNSAEKIKSTKTVKIVIVAKLNDRRKNVPETLKLITDLMHETELKYDVTIFGQSNADGISYVESIIDLYKELNVKILRNQKRRTIRSVMSKSHFCFLMSDNEQAGFSPIEAAYCGLIPVMLKRSENDNPISDYFSEETSVIFRGFDDQIAKTKFLNLVTYQNRFDEMRGRLKSEVNKFRLKDQFLCIKNKLN